MKTKIATVDGLDIFCVEEGEGEPVLFLHGWAASSKFWRLTIPALAGRHRCVAFDWPGFGGSDKRDAPYGVDWYADLLPRVMDALELPSAAVVAHSMGGAIAVTSAHARPDRIRKLVLVNALVEGRSALSLHQKIACFRPFRPLAWLLTRNRWLRRRAGRNLAHARTIADDLIDEVLRSTYASIFRNIDSIRRTDVLARLAELPMPVFAIYTDQDRILRRTQYEHQLRLVPRTAVLPGTGHCPMLENPDEFQRVLLNYLSQ